ncbi:hypothetical protein FACS1894172_16500 [Spirochaetia bacterium]|nr:hypothetical protein FACS1894164_06250 [Spirochaetia bacterium]GHU35153.1 hypothetical protein FACS1894172_16500 [Spirochaetia bacterium]
MPEEQSTPEPAGIIDQENSESEPTLVPGALRGVPAEGVAEGAAGVCSEGEASPMVLINDTILESAEEFDQKDRNPEQLDLSEENVPEPVGIVDQEKEDSPLARILKQEIELVDSIAVLQEKVRAAVITREWTDFESHQSALGAAQEAFETLEEERQKYAPEETHFYAATAVMDPEERKQLSELYRTLKFKVMGIRLAGDALVTYLDEAKITISAFVDQAFPDRKGKVYGRTGTQVPADMRSLVIDISG